MQISSAVSEARRCGHRTLSIMQTAAQESLGELLATLLITPLVCSFAATPATASFFITSAAVQLIANITLQVTKQVLIEKNKGSYTKNFDRLSARIFWFGSARNLQTLVHELGHALAALCCFQNARPEILLENFSGLTSYYGGHLRGIGLWLGRPGARIFTTAAGAGLSLGVSSILLKKALRMPGKETKTKAYLLYIAWADFWVHTFLALSALVVSPVQSHDFVFLSFYGLHPIAAAVGIIAIPILITAYSRTPLPTESGC